MQDANTVSGEIANEAFQTDGRKTAENASLYAYHLADSQASEAYSTVSDNTTLSKQPEYRQEDPPFQPIILMMQNEEPQMQKMPNIIINNNPNGEDNKTNGGGGEKNSGGENNGHDGSPVIVAAQNEKNQKVSSELIRILRLFSKGLGHFRNISSV